MADVLGTEPHAAGRAGRRCAGRASGAWVVAIGVGPVGPVRDRARSSPGSASPPALGASAAPGSSPLRCAPGSSWCARAGLDSSRRRGQPGGSSAPRLRSTDERPGAAFRPARPPRIHAQSDGKVRPLAAAPETAGFFGGSISSIRASSGPRTKAIRGPLGTWIGPSRSSARRATPAGRCPRRGSPSRSRSARSRGAASRRPGPSFSPVRAPEMFTAMPPSSLMQRTNRSPKTRVSSETILKLKAVDVPVRRLPRIRGLRDGCG